MKKSKGHLSKAVGSKGVHGVAVPFVDVQMRH